ncbi:hypothetical protein AMAG_04871 [Allomyces macrogynus ATCC 38327]|uniref:Chitin-binding type-4 domain-containing protein n=1 Tax=Allomyces macrogynus (strain ATCC 38327) TaxID=578462 RepID=A0A0L0S6I5_ALLM3|nr:hypothetical protein AMAG_04871 [Allomyces macrogynus ATCC 38327]|eukprot:KNE58045.1 hypothetical protein AMAG_04871 [Allomyces macrogynus ATCC 38327]
MAVYHVLSALVVAAMLFGRVDAHMQMKSPFPRLDPANPAVPESQKDYNIVAPLGWNNLYPFPCRGAPVGSSVLTVQPGSTIQVQLGGGAAHNGGHCQFSISYNGQDFVVLKTVLTGCMAAAGNSFSVPVPSTTPGGKAIFSWSWVNASGNREFYQNCADITINGPATGALSGPKMVVANVPGYPTIGEFGAGADPGLSYYQSAPTIQIAPSGGSGAAASASSYVTTTALANATTSARTTAVAASAATPATSNGSAASNGTSASNGSAEDGSPAPSAAPSAPTRAAGRQPARPVFTRVRQPAAVTPAPVSTTTTTTTIRAVPTRRPGRFNVDEPIVETDITLASTQPTHSTGGNEAPSSPLAPADAVIDVPTVPAAAPEAELAAALAAPDAEPAVVYTTAPAAPAAPGFEPAAPAPVPDYLAAQPDTQGSPTVTTPAVSKLSRPTTARPSDCYVPPPMVISPNGTTTDRRYRSQHYGRRQRQPKATPAPGTPLTTEPTFY